MNGHGADDYELVILVLAILAVFFLVKSCNAEEVKTTVVFWNDFVKPESGSSFLQQWAEFQWSVDKINAGADIFTNAQKDYAGARPYMTFNFDKELDVIVGYQTDSKGAEYALAGFWYYPSFGKTTVFLDAREYSAISRTAKDYLEIFLGPTYWATDKNSIGLELVYDRYWQMKADEYTAGICVSRRLTPSLAVFIRPTKDWYVSKISASTVTDSVRAGAKISF